MSSTPPLILASTSRYRREMLQRLRVEFDCAAPGADEALVPGEAPMARAARLAQQKALSLSTQHPGRWVLGSDQVCSQTGQILRKPGSIDRQIEQLTQLSGQEVEFFTAISLCQRDRQHFAAVVTTTVQFRALSQAQIRGYANQEPAPDCAGGFKAEGLGITLFERISSDDPTALIGLPLIACTSAFRQAGLLDR